MKKKMRGWLFIIAIAMLLVAACSKEEPEKEPVTGPLEEEDRRTGRRTGNALSSTFYRCSVGRRKYPSTCSCDN